MPNVFTTKFPTFSSPRELVTMYDENLLTEKAKLYDWQIQFMDYFARDIPLDENIQQALIAANGSGKSQFILAPCIVWMAVSFDDCLCYVTSSSAEQLDTQTERYIRQLAERMNTVHVADGGMEVWEIRKRHLRFIPTGSYIDLLATDEKTKAEGKHPLKMGAEFLVAVDEGKSVTEEIYSALDRCTGFTRKLYSSSPGEHFGEFYDVCTAEPTGKGAFEDKNELGWNILKATAFDCPHIKQYEIQSIIKKHGIDDPLVRSSIFAEFTSIGTGKTLLEMLTIKKCVSEGQAGRIRLIESFGFHAGLDLSAGGDEQTFSAWVGNKEVGKEEAHIKDYEQLIQQIINWCLKYKSYGCCWEQGKCNIWADDGGVGWGIIGGLGKEKYFVNRILNQHRAVDNLRYANRGTEAWFNFKRFVEEYQVIMIPDKISESQLSNRYYKVQEVTNKLILESKEEARRKGHPSPDRADAKVLAWLKFTYPLAELANNSDSNLPSELLDGQHRSIEDVERAIRKSAANPAGDAPTKVFDGELTQSIIVEQSLGSSVSNRSIFGTNPATMNKYRHLIGKMKR